MHTIHTLFDSQLFYTLCTFIRIIIRWHVKWEFKIFAVANVCIEREWAKRKRKQKQYKLFARKMSMNAWTLHFACILWMLLILRIWGRIFFHFFADTLQLLYDPAISPSMVMMILMLMEQNSMEWDTIVMCWVQCSHSIRNENIGVYLLAAGGGGLIPICERARASHMQMTYS